MTAILAFNFSTGKQRTGLPKGILGHVSADHHLFFAFADSSVVSLHLSTHLVHLAPGSPPLHLLLCFVTMKQILISALALNGECLRNVLFWYEASAYVLQRSYDVRHHTRQCHILIDILCPFSSSPLPGCSEGFNVGRVVRCNPIIL